MENNCEKSLVLTKKQVDVVFNSVARECIHLDTLISYYPDDARLKELYELAKEVHHLVYSYKESL